MVTKTKDRVDTVMEELDKYEATSKKEEVIGLEEFMNDLAHDGQAIHPPDMSRWPKLEDIQEQLEEPFDESLWETRAGPGGTTLTYVAWNEYVKRLNRLAYGHWSSRITGVYGEGNGTTMTVEVTIYGVSHEDTSDPDTPTSSYATALKRACSKFGLGLHLYDLGGKKGSPKASAPSYREPGYPTTYSPPSNTNAVGGGTGKRPTEKMIYALVERNRVPRAFVETIDYDTASAMMNDIIQNKVSLRDLANKYQFSLPSDGLPIRS